MTAIDLISDTVPPLKVTDLGGTALQWMKEFGVHHLPILKNDVYKGLISDEEIIDLNEPDEILKSYAITFCKSSIGPDEHVFEVAKFAISNHLSIIPVVDNEGTYLGSITLRSLLEKIGQLLSLTEEGSIIVLELNQRDYMLSQIAKLAENNGVLIQSLTTTSIPESMNILVTLKMSSKDIQGFTAALERFDYDIKATFKENQFADDLKERYDAFLKFLDI